MARRALSVPEGADQLGNAIALWHLDHDRQCGASTTLAPVVIGLIAHLVGADLRVDMRNGQSPMVVGLPLTAAFALLFAVLGWGALAVLERLTAWAALIWTVVAVIVLLVSFLPIVAAEATNDTKGALALMHLAVAAVLIPGLRGRRATV